VDELKIFIAKLETKSLAFKQKAAEKDKLKDDIDMINKINELK